MLPNSYKTILDSITADYDQMILLLEEWVNINSYTENLSGLAEMMTALKQSFNSLSGQMEEIALRPRQIINRKGQQEFIPLGKALHIKKHPAAPIQVFFGGHMDTVYPLASSFQKATFVDSSIMKGPGVTDMKGGLIIMLKTLQALEASPYAGKIGWEVLINPDEEIGSPGSAPLFTTCAARNKLGLIFEPSFADGRIVGPRKGSSTFTIISKGRSAHSGRDFFVGRNAIAALAKFVVMASELTDESKGITVNTGLIEGGEATNVVPNLAIGRINVRTWNQEDFLYVRNALESIIAELNQAEGHHIILHEDNVISPKPFDEEIKSLFSLLTKCAKLIGFDFQITPSGGTCDGSRLYTDGLPNIDSLGIVGGCIHTEEEYAFLPSLIERTQLATLFVLLFANIDNLSL